MDLLEVSMAADTLEAFFESHQPLCRGELLFKSRYGMRAKAEE